MRVSNSFCKHRERYGSLAGYNRASYAFEIDPIIDITDVDIQYRTRMYD
jgi:hypothetical protein